jgi:hypothetical protein
MNLIALSARNNPRHERTTSSPTVYRRRPWRPSISEAFRRTNAAESKIRARVGHVFAEQKERILVHWH